MDEMFTHKDSFGDQFRMWFCQDGSAILATGNGPTDGICIEVSADAVVRLATFLTNGVVASITAAMEEEFN